MEVKLNAEPKAIPEASLKQDNVWQYLAVLPTWMASASLFVLMMMTFFDVLMRSIFNNPIESATELTRLFMAIIVFSSLPIVSWKGKNIIVDLLDPLFTRRLALIRDITIDLVCGIVLLWPAKRVLELAERARSYGDVTEYLNMPQHYIAWYIAFFTFATALTFIARGLARIFVPSKVHN